MPEPRVARSRATSFLLHGVVSGLDEDRACIIHTLYCRFELSDVPQMGAGTVGCRLTVSEYNIYARSRSPVREYLANTFCISKKTHLVILFL